MYCLGAGGSGWGDPLSRSVDAVVNDVFGGVVSLEMAAQIYGVSINPDGSANVDSTNELRHAARIRRLATAEVDSGYPIEDMRGECPHCGTNVTAGEAKLIEVPWQELGPAYSRFTETAFRMLAGVCRTCGTLIATRNHLDSALAVSAPKPA